jgi:bla regulator protein BlaR1
MSPGCVSAVANHLWQSTLFAGFAGLLTLALRNNHARVRHGVWLAASCKFLIPLSLLMALGAHIRWWSAPEQTRSNLLVVMDEVSRPFAVPSVSPPLPAPAPYAANLLPAVLWVIWGCGFLGISSSWWVRWRRLRVAVRRGSPMRLAIPIPAVSSPTLVEPGVFGVFRPVLLLPEGVLERLTPAQLRAVIAHELCHVRHRDNPVSAVHMFVETVFWFHPLVWWIGKRMVDERERACDEEVLRLGNTPHAYAEGILNICKFYVESPLVCASGVTGADLKKRIEKIMAHRCAHNLDWTRKSLLATVGIAAAIGPIAMGVIWAPSSHAQSQSAAVNTAAFEVASVKPNKSATGRWTMDRSPGGGFSATNATLKMLIKAAYSIYDHQLIGGPGWLESERFDIVAKAPPHTPDNQLGPMLRTLLTDRFKLKLHRETRQMPVYALVLGKDGPKFQEVTREAREGDGDSRKGRGHLAAQRVPISDLAEILSGELGLSVLDRTGLKGFFDLNLEWTPDESQVRGAADGPDGRVRTPAPDPNGPSIFTALQEQLGLKLEKQIGPVEVLVIDHVERPSEN